MAQRAERRARGTDQDDHNHTGEEQLDDDENGISCPELVDVSVHARHDVGHGLTDRDQNPKELLGTSEQRTVLAQRLVHLDDLRAGEQLHDKAGRHDWTDAKLHQRTTVRRKDHTDPVERISAFGGLDPVQRDLAANQEDEQSDDGPEDLFPEWDLRYAGRQRT